MTPGVRNADGLKLLRNMRSDSRFWSSGLNLCRPPTLATWGPWLTGSWHRDEKHTTSFQIDCKSVDGALTLVESEVVCYCLEACGAILILLLHCRELHPCDGLEQMPQKMSEWLLNETNPVNEVVIKRVLYELHICSREEQLTQTKVQKQRRSSLRMPQMPVFLQQLRSPLVPCYREQRRFAFTFLPCNLKA